MFQLVEYALYWQLLDTEYSSVWFPDPPQPTNQWMQLIDGFFGSIVYTLILCIFMFKAGKSFKTEFPWISAKSTIAYRENAGWPCVPPIVRFWTDNCMCCNCCYVWLLGYSDVEPNVIIDESVEPQDLLTNDDNLAII